MMQKQSIVTKTSFIRKGPSQFINNSWVTFSARSLDVQNPATDELIATIAFGGKEDAKAAIDSAQEAFFHWRKMTAYERGALILNLANLMLKHKNDLATLMTLEQGKPLAEAKGEIEYAASFLTWASEEGKRLYGDVLPASSENKRILVIPQPIGVVACITPWNFPSAMITRKIGPALACGCTVVIKPSELTPLSALAIAQLAEEAGFPKGVINVINGDPVEISDCFLEDFRVRKLSFTGSTAVGKSLMDRASKNVTRLSLELGGHAPFIVFDDADVNKAVEGAVASKFRNMGQTCVSSNRFLVQEGIYDDFFSELKTKVEALTVGNGLKKDVSIGPLINNAAIQKVVQQVEDAKAKGATVRLGGQQVRPDASVTDRFFQPTIIENCNSDMAIFNEETFGPVTPMKRFKNESEAIAEANNSRAGLAAYFYTQNASRLIRVAEALDYGIVGANDGSPSTAQAPFGGVKESGFGREGGKYVMEDYTQKKYISWAL